MEVEEYFYSGTAYINYEPDITFHGIYHNTDGFSSEDVLESVVKYYKEKFNANEVVMKAFNRI